MNQTINKKVINKYDDSFLSAGKVTNKANSPKITLNFAVVKH